MHESAAVLVQRRIRLGGLREVGEFGDWPILARRLCMRTAGVSCGRELRRCYRPDLVRGIRRSW